MECAGAVEFAQFVILVSISVAPEIFCDSSDCWMMVGLIGEGLLLLIPALPWPMHGFSVLPFMGLVCCFSGRMFGSKFFLMPWTSGSLIPLDFVWDHVVVPNNSLCFLCCNIFHEVLGTYWKKLVLFHEDCYHHDFVLIGNHSIPCLFLLCNIN